MFIISVNEPSDIELEEWEAFLNSNISEVMDGDVESLTQLNMVGLLQLQIYLFILVLAKLSS